MTAPQSYRMLLAYDGSRYHGWQAQPQVPTVAGELTRVIAKLTQERPVIAAAGRTDAGAHAHGQVVAFALSSPWAPQALGSACGRLLPEDIAVLQTTFADPAFHPRWQAWRRTYRYLIRDGAGHDPVGRQYEWRVPLRLELSPMRAAARLLRGRHDFAAFGSSPLPGGSTTRLVDRVELERQGGVVVLEVRADAFLRGMMRNFAGALVAVGAGAVRVEDIGSAPEAGRRVAARWKTAPAHGLHQWRVDYLAQPEPLRS